MSEREEFEKAFLAEFEEGDMPLCALNFCPRQNEYTGSESDEYLCLWNGRWEGWQARAQHGADSGEAVGIVKHTNDPRSDNPKAVIEWLFGGDEINLPHDTKLYTKPPANQVPDGITLDALSLREAAYWANPDKTLDEDETEVRIEWMPERISTDGEHMAAGHYLYYVDCPEEGVIGPLGEDPVPNEALLSTQPDAGAGQWIPCSDRLPTEDDGDFEGFVWVNDEHGVWFGQWRHVEAENHTHWMPTGLRKPQPPQGEDK